GLLRLHQPVGARAVALMAGPVPFRERPCAGSHGNNHGYSLSWFFSRSPPVPGSRGSSAKPGQGTKLFCRKRETFPSSLGRRGRLASKRGQAASELPDQSNLPGDCRQVAEPLSLPEMAEVANRFVRADGPLTTWRSVTYPTSPPC